jgi:PIN domain nuclease of toxin-antitoxin system
MYLLDTHALVWAVTAPELLPPPVQTVVATSRVIVSVVSYWELMLKRGRVSAPVRQPASWWDRYVTRAAVEVLPIRVPHVDQLDALAEWHRDPFDRMLVAQALTERATLVSGDRVLARYGVPLLWSAQE